MLSKYSEVNGKLTIVSVCIEIMTAPLNLGRPREEGRNLSQSVDAISAILRSDRSRAALRYWVGKSENGRVPDKSDMDPVEMVAFLPSIVLIDVVGDHQNYRFRLVGGGVRYHLNHDITGKLLTETKGLVIGRRLTCALTECTLMQMPTSTLADYQGPHADYRQIEALLLPLTSDGGQVDRVMAILQFFQEADADAGRHADSLCAVGN